MNRASMGTFSHFNRAEIGERPGEFKVQVVRTGENDWRMRLEASPVDNTVFLSRMQLAEIALCIYDALRKEEANEQLGAVDQPEPAPAA